MRWRRRHVLALAVGALLWGVSVAALAGEVAGHVSRLAGEAMVRRAGQQLAVAVGTEVRSRDVVVTGAASRVEVTFADGTRLTLAETTEMAVDAWAFQPEEGKGNLGLRLVGGALSAQAGRIAELPGHPLRVRLPVATIGIRGTRFWAGPLDGRIGVLLIEGGIYVENISGRVDLTEPGNGVFLPPPDPATAAEMAEDAADWVGPGAPLARGGAATRPMPWSADRVARALATVGFGE